VKQNELLSLLNTTLEVGHKLAAVDHLQRDFGVGEPLTRAEIHMLVAVQMLAPASVTELAKHKGISKAAVSQLLARLAGKGLVAKQPDAANVSRLHVRLSRRGHLACKGHERVHDEILELVRRHTNDLTDKEWAAFRKVLSRFGQLLDEALGSPL
jgi:DNA-binding MarR family transcriptional regulator